MRAGTIRKVLLLLTFLPIVIFTQAQQIKPCGPYTINKELFKNALEYERAHRGKFAPTTPLVLRVFFHICEPTQGTLIDVTEDQINLEFKHLVGAYAADNICFVNAGYDRIYNTALDTFNFSNDNKNIFLPYGIQNCITIFYITKLGGTNGSSGGGASGITFGPLPTAWTIVQKSYMGKGVLEHEVGHCFGLLHTFDFKSGNGLEDIDGSNGASSADLIGDTPADPYVFNYEDATIPPCFSGGCSYTGTCTDPKGRIDYSPPYNNTMSYWCGFVYPTGRFTTGQYTRVSSFLNTAAVLQVCESQNTVTESNINISSGFHMNSAATTLTTSGNVLITGTTNALFGAGQTVFLEPGFDAVPSGTGRVFIRHAFCDTTSNGYTFSGIASKSSPMQNTIKNIQGKIENPLIAFPNPANTTVTVSFNLTHGETLAAIELYNINSKQVKQISLANINMGKHSVSINTSNLPAGFYEVVLRLSSQIITTRIVIAR